MTNVEYVHSTTRAPWNGVRQRPSHGETSVLSMGIGIAYIDCLNRGIPTLSRLGNQLPTKHSLQPLWQQEVVGDVHWQYFCIKKKLIPSTDQSVARHVVRAVSNRRTPSFIDDDVLRLVEQSVKLISPFKFCRRFQKVVKRLHLLCHSECIGPLVDQAKPRSST